MVQYVAIRTIWPSAPRRASWIESPCVSITRRRKNHHVHRMVWLFVTVPRPHKTGETAGGARRYRRNAFSLALIADASNRAIRPYRSHCQCFGRRTEADGSCAQCSIPPIPNEQVPLLTVESFVSSRSIGLASVPSEAAVWVNLTRLPLMRRVSTCHVPSDSLTARGSTSCHRPELARSV